MVGGRPSRRCAEFPPATSTGMILVVGPDRQRQDDDAELRRSKRLQSEKTNNHHDRRSVIEYQIPGVNQTADQRERSKLDVRQPPLRSISAPGSRRHPARREFRDKRDGEDSRMQGGGRRATLRAGSTAAHRQTRRRWSPA